MDSRRRTAAEAELKESPPVKKIKISEDKQAQKANRPSYSIVCLNSQYKGILALDIDETLIDEQRSNEEKKPVFINRKLMRQRILFAKRNQFLVVFVTSRYNPDCFFQEERERRQHVLADTIAKKMKLKNILCFYTSGGSKLPVLEDLRATYFSQSSETEGKQKICLVDDSDKNLMVCSNAGFSTVDSKAENLYALMDDFLGFQQQQKQEMSNLSCSSASMQICVGSANAQSSSYANTANCRFYSPAQPIEEEVAHTLSRFSQNI